MSTDPNHVVIIDYLRTPFAKASGKVPGRLGDVAPVDLLVPLINGLIDRTGIDPSKVKKVLTGCVAPESVQGMNIAREAVMHADSKLPDSVAGTTLDMFCASSMDAIAMAAGRVKMNPNGVYIASGVQSMSQVPMGGHNFMPHPKLDRTNSIPNEYLKNYHFMPATAENLARRGSISREAQDAFAMRSNQRLAAATSER